MKLEDRPTKETDAKQNALITQLDSHLINHENSTLEMILLARRLERERDALKEALCDLLGMSGMDDLEAEANAHELLAALRAKERP